MKNEKVKNYWGYTELIKLGYKVLVTEKDNKHIVNIKGNGYNEKFNIIEIENTFLININDVDITNDFDFTDTLDNCINGCIYYFYTRY